MYSFIFMLVVGLLVTAGIINALIVDYKRYKNAYTLSMVIGYCFLSATVVFVAVTTLLTIKYGRMADLVVAVP